MSFARFMAGPVGRGVRVVAGAALIVAGLVMGGAGGYVLAAVGLVALLAGALNFCLIALFEANVDAAFNVAHRIVWNRADAHDVVQNAFIKAARARGQLLDASRARSWLLSITYREALMVLRARRDTPTDPAELPDHVGTPLGPEDLALRHELALVIQRAIERLPEALRVALVLRDCEAVLEQTKSVIGLAQQHGRVELGPEERDRLWRRIVSDGVVDE